MLFDAPPPKVLKVEQRSTKPFAIRNSIQQSYNDALRSLHLNGFVNAFVKDTSSVGDTLAVSIHVGERKRWGSLEVAEADKHLLNKAGIEADQNNKPFQFERYAARLEKLLIYLEDNGYPFAELTTDSVFRQGDSINVKLRLDKKKFVTIDSIYIPADARIARRYLYNYLQINPGDPYSESLIRKIPTRIRELQFLELQRTPFVTFYADRAVLNLLVKNRNQNKFDFILGVAPTPTSAVGKRLLVTGDGRLNLLNALGKGERMDLRFEKLQARTTRIRTEASYPFIFNLPFGVDAGFNLFLNDTLYRNLEYNVGLLYLFTGTNSVKVYFGRFQSRLITVDTSTLKLSKTLPQTLDVNQDRYGVAYNIDKTNFRLNPSAGFAFGIDGAVSRRKIIRNVRITSLTDPLNPEYNFNALYDTMKLENDQLLLTANAAFYQRLFSQLVLALQTRGGFMSGDALLTNELYRLGGFRSLRGFDEESIPSRWYGIGTVELRYLLSTYSYANLFSDIAYVSRRDLEGFRNDVPIGVGSGLNFQTKAGIFSLNYAVGRTDQSGFDFRAAKIHFGYLTVF